jgi:AAA domain
MPDVEIMNGIAHIPFRDGRTERVILDHQWWDEESGYPVDALLETWLLSSGDPDPDVDLETVVPALERAIDEVRPELEELHELKLTLAGIPIGELASTLRTRREPPSDWLVPGLSRRGGVTLIGGREKLSGKSTLVAHLSACLERGEPTVFGGEPKESVRTLWVTEEPRYSLREKADDFDLKRVHFIQLSDWATVPDLPMGTFQEKLKLIEQIALQARYEHVVIDPLARIAGIRDESGNELGERVDEASQLAQRAHLGLSVIHHNNKGAGRAAIDRMRGSTSLTAAVDTIIQIDPIGKKPRCRKLTAIGRVRESNWEKIIQLDEGNSSYTLVVTSLELADTPEDADPSLTPLDALREAGPGSNAKEILEAKGVEVTKYAQQQIRKKLDALLPDSLVEREGTQQSGYRYTAAEGGG